MPHIYQIYQLMADDEGLVGLRGLHQDLVALEASRLRNIDRLWADLEARVNEFRQLLDKAPKSDASRKALQSGEPGCPLSICGYVRVLIEFIT